jgi:hypothetical protein
MGEVKMATRVERLGYVTEEYRGIGGERLGVELPAR